MHSQTILSRFYDGFIASEQQYFGAGLIILENEAKTKLNRTEQNTANALFINHFGQSNTLIAPVMHCKNDFISFRSSHSTEQTNLDI